jgi:ABC-type uncharacterized transport system auxiliary subunit
MITRAFGIAAAAALLGGCINIPKSNTQDDPPKDIYTLKAPAAGAVKGGGSVVVVAKPDVPPGYDTDRIALVFAQGHRLDYYAGAAWSGRLSDLLQTFIIQSARRELHGAVVGTSEMAGAARYKLLVKVTDFQPVYAAGPEGIPRLDVAMNMTLVDVGSGRVAATVNARKSAKASANRMTVVTKELESLLQAATDQGLRGIASHMAQS